MWLIFFIFIVVNVVNAVDVDMAGDVVIVISVHIVNAIYVIIVTVNDEVDCHLFIYFIEQQM